MPLACSCNWDWEPEPGAWCFDWPNISNIDFEPLDTKKRKRCASCGELIEIGALCLRHKRHRYPYTEKEKMNFTYIEAQNLLEIFGGDEDTEITVVEHEGVKKAIYTECPEEGSVDITSELIGGGEDVSMASKDTANKDLLEYLRKEIREGKIDFGMRATETGNGMDFYIHPLSASGETIDFCLFENGDEVGLALANKTEWNTNPTEILINTIPHSIPTGTEELSYEDVVKLAGMKQGVIYSMVYKTPRKGGDIYRQGIMNPGKSIRIESGMWFDVAYTG